MPPQKPQNFKEPKLPKGLSAICEKDIDMDYGVGGGRLGII